MESTQYGQSMDAEISIFPGLFMSHDPKPRVEPGMLKQIVRVGPDRGSGQEVFRRLRVGPGRLYPTRPARFNPTREHPRLLMVVFKRPRGKNPSASSQVFAAACTVLHRTLPVPYQVHITSASPDTAHHTESLIALYRNLRSDHHHFVGHLDLI